MRSEARPGFGDADRELIDLAVVYALDAVSDAERRDIESRVAGADPEVAAAFDRETAAVRETMALMSAATATEPPARLRERLLDAVAAESAPPAAPVSLDERRNRRRNFLLSAAAAILVAVGGFAVVTQLQDETATTSEQVFAAEDVRTTSGEIEGGGVATVVYSKEADAGVLVMNNVAPPAEGSVYQMWLITPAGPESAGIMDAEAVAPSTTAVLEGVGHSTALAFSVEPPGGSTQPTQIFAQLPLG